jgi:hypothetical protein
MRIMKDTYHSNGVAWEHWPETTAEWETWKIWPNGRMLRVQRIDPNTSLKPSGFQPYDWNAEYHIYYQARDVDDDVSMNLPADTPLDEVLALAIAHARIG